MIDSSIIPQEKHEPTEGEIAMSRSINFLVGRLLCGDLDGLAVCAISSDGEESAFYINTGSEDVLRDPMEHLRVMYETNRMFGRLNNAPQNNRSCRRH